MRIPIRMKNEEAEKEEGNIKKTKHEKPSVSGSVNVNAHASTPYRLSLPCHVSHALTMDSN